MYCSNCGNKITEGTICSKCSTSVLNSEKKMIKRISGKFPYIPIGIVITLIICMIFVSVNTSELIVGKWETTYILIGDEPFPIPEDRRFTAKFNANGSWSMELEKMHGTWENFDLKNSSEGKTYSLKDPNGDFSASAYIADNKLLLSANGLEFIFEK